MIEINSVDLQCIYKNMYIGTYDPRLSSMIIFALLQNGPVISRGNYAHVIVNIQKQGGSSRNNRTIGHNSKIHNQAPAGTSDSGPQKLVAV